MKTPKMRSDYAYSMVGKKGKYSTGIKKNSHCPICGCITNRYNDTFYCEECCVDLDEHGNILS